MSEEHETKKAKVEEEIQASQPVDLTEEDGPEEDDGVVVEPPNEHQEIDPQLLGGKDKDEVKDIREIDDKLQTPFLITFSDGMTFPLIKKESGFSKVQPPLLKFKNQFCEEIQLSRKEYQRATMEALNTFSLYRSECSAALVYQFNQWSADFRFQMKEESAETSTTTTTTTEQTPAEQALQLIADEKKE